MKNTSGPFHTQQILSDISLDWKKTLVSMDASQTASSCSSLQQ